MENLAPAKKVITHDLNGNENGYIIELFKEDRKTKVYLTTIKKGGFKGYHLHRIRSSNYVCIRGVVKIILYTDTKKEEYILNADKPERLHIPPKVATGLKNIRDEEVWIVNFPEPPYDPEQKNEQIEFTEKELEEKIKAGKKSGHYTNI
ncbi:MAG: WxcM-like domain-containing protein [Nanoarchaeota archaeon]